MMQSLPAVLVVLISVGIPVSHSPAQTAGARDYGLGGSSVMWMPRGGSLFLNPAELARINQGELFFTSGRFHSLASFSASAFVPFVGTFSAGVAPAGSASQYSFGYARRVAGHHSFGAALSGFRNTDETFGISLGGSLHFPETTESSGLHAGFSIMNLSDQTSSPFFSVNAGAGYWVLPDFLRLQAAYRHTPAKNDVLVGTDVAVTGTLSAQIGTRSFGQMAAGVTLNVPFGSVQLSFGKAGAFLSFSASLSRPASASRSFYHEQGQAAAEEERYFEAAYFFRTAVEYDPFFVEGRQAAEACDSLLEALTAPMLAEAEQHLERKRFLEATRAYSRVLRMNRGHPEARRRLREIQPQMESYFTQLVTGGDSLRERRENEKALRNYQLALELDPGNDSIAARIAELREVSRTNVQAVLRRADAFLNRNQLDAARREYERVLSVESRNARALRGLETIRSRRTGELLRQGATAFNAADHMKALEILLQVLEQDPRNREAEDLLAQTREALKPAAENLFRVGLQYYTRDNLKSAIEEWNKALLINPQHAATLEYKKRAEEKLQALERLK